MAVSATSAEQAKLLDLAAIDTKLIQLNHQRTGVPEITRVHELEVELGSIEMKIVAADTEVSDLTASQEKAESDVQQVADRVARDQARLDGGSATPKELEGLQHELGTLAGRLAELEEVELEVMQQLEDAQSALAELTLDREKVSTQLAETQGVLASKFAELDAQISEQKTNRAAIVAELPKDLVDLNEKIRTDFGGVGAAHLHRGACQGCHISLDAEELNRIKATPAETVVRCEQCRRILVRTAESGL